MAPLLPSPPPPPPPPAPAWQLRINAVTARLAGREMATRFGPAGVPRLPGAEVRLSAAGRARAGASVLFLVPGGPWPGVAKNGGGWLAPWAAALRGQGVGRVVPVPLMADRDAVTATFEQLWARMARHHEAHVVRAVRAELAARPPAAGGGVWLLGHSSGAVVACEAATRLPGVAGVVALETHLASTGYFLPRLPAVPAALVAENEAGWWPQAPAGTAVERVLLPGLTHMDLVLRPPARLLAAVVGAIAGEPAP